MPDLEPTRQGLVDVEGFRIHWERFGSGEREVVCLLNGLAMHTKAWYPFLPRLVDRHDVLLFDYPGQGESSADDVPVTMPQLARQMAAAADAAGVARLHAMGISYGGFVAIEFARLFRERLHTLTLSGILLSHERLFEMYEALSLRFYRGGPEQFDLYTHYMYEKIFGEQFVRSVGDALDAMRQRFADRYRDRIHVLVRLTEAQDPFFAALDERMPEYRAIDVPTLVMPGTEDRAIPAWVQRRICDVLPDARYLPIEGSGHVVYLEQPDVFWPSLLAFTAARSTGFVVDPPTPAADAGTSRS